MRMRIATLPCPGPSFTVLAGALLKANGDRHTLLSPVQPAYWLTFSLQWRIVRTDDSSQGAQQTRYGLSCKYYHLPPWSRVRSVEQHMTFHHPSTTIIIVSISHQSKMNGSKGSPQAQKRRCQLLLLAAGTRPLQKLK